MTDRLARTARQIAASVLDPEMPILTLDDLGIIREVCVDGTRVVVTITPTYSGCPAMSTMRDDLEYTLFHAGFTEVTVLTSLAPAWSSDWISADGRKKLAENGYSIPGPVTERPNGPVALTLTARPRPLTCPQCGSSSTQLCSEFSSTLCKALYRCLNCLESFDHVKEI